MKFLKKLGFFTAFILPALVVVGFYLGSGWNFLSVFFSFVVITTIDHLTGVDTSNVEPTKVKLLAEEFFYRFVTYIWTFFQLGFIIWAAYAITLGKVSTPVEWIGFVIGTALVTGGIGITVAHELGHKKSSLERFYSKLLLMTVCYMHFYIEHNRGHHVNVATPIDPATARKNQNFYSFWIQSVFGSYVHALKLENEKLSRNGKNWLNFSNEMLWFSILPFVFCTVLTFAFSYFQGKIIWEIPIFFFAQSFIAFSLLELVNYVEHYGIMRKQIDNSYERVNPLHSWNASHLISNFFLFQLQRHSDHHANAIKRYQVLNHYDQSPQLPFGYPTMVMLALVPPLWFKVMNHRLEIWHKTVFQPAEA